MFNMPIRGAVVYSLTGTAPTDVRCYINVDPNGNPIFAWPDIKTSGRESARIGVDRQLKWIRLEPA
jgi:hypothetical protein